MWNNDLQPENDIEEIKELTSDSFYDCVWVPDGYDSTQIPENTSRNFKVLMDKINELTRELNDLTRRLS